MKVKDAYTGGRFGHFAHDSDVPGVDFGLAHFLGVHVEPEVVGAVAPEVVLVATQVQVPHTT